MKRMIMLLIMIPLFLCWGSLLNCLGYRIVRGLRSFSLHCVCPRCHHKMPWYMNIPIVPWFLSYHCSSCDAPIPYLSIVIELFTTLSLTLLWLVCPTQYFFAYFILFSALIVNMRSDIEMMLISRFTTWGIIPLGLVLSIMQGLPITLISSLWGMSIGYFSLYSISWLFFKITGKRGIGEGDFDLLALIGTFVGPWYCWQTLWFGSVLGSCYGLFLLYMRRSTRSQPIPFGPFLSVSAIGIILLYFFAPDILTFDLIS